MIIPATDVKSPQMFFMFRMKSCLYITIMLLLYKLNAFFFFGLLAVHRVTWLFKMAINQFTNDESKPTLIPIVMTMGNDNNNNNALIFRE